MTTLTIHGLRKRYGERQALDGVSFEVRAGEIFGFVGGNGAGKTTTMRAVLGMLQPDEGEVLVDGRTITAADRRRKWIFGTAGMAVIAAVLAGVMTLFV